MDEILSNAEKETRSSNESERGFHKIEIIRLPEPFFE